MMTTLMRDPAEGWAAAGRGIAGGLGALLSGEAVRQKARMDAEGQLADIYYRNMMGNQAGASAKRHEQEATGLRLTNDARVAPIDTNLPAFLQTAQRLFQMTGDTNMERFANAGTALQTQGIRDQAADNVGDVDLMNRLNTLAKPGETYMPFNAVGNTGGAINQATGEGAVFDQVLHKLFDQESRARAAKDRGAANASNASAGRSTADADLTRERLSVLRTTGRLPGTIGGGEDATNAKTRNAVIAAIEREMPGLSDQEFAAELAVRLSRRGIDVPPVNKNPAPGTSAPKNPKPEGMTTQMVLDQARAAIAQGKDREAVIQRLREMGVDPKGL
jgi:hypothetical protein